MRADFLLWTSAATAGVSTIASFALDCVAARKVTYDAQYVPLKTLLWAAASLQLVSVGSIVYFSIFFARRKALSAQRATWIEYSAGAVFATLALVAAGVGSIWLLTKSDAFPEGSSHVKSAVVVIWAVTLVAQINFYSLLATRTRKLFKKKAATVLVTSFGITLPPAKELAYGTRPSFCSRDTTLASASRPCTPNSSQAYSLHSSTTKVASSFRSKFTRNSARSSLDLPPFPANEATALGSAFDRYDTSNLDTDMRHTVLSSSPVLNRSSLEPIIESKSGSPSSVILPTSPRLRQQRSQRAQSPTPTSRKFRSDEPFKPKPHTRPSSPPPPNFSHPTSPRAQQNPHSPPSISSHFQVTTPSSSVEEYSSQIYNQNQNQNHQPWTSFSPCHKISDSICTLKQHRLSASFIHPLFRPDSPFPPQVMTPNTMVTASPLANQTITPKSLARLRSDSDLNRRVPANKTGDWRVMPPTPPSPGPLGRPRSKSHSSVMSPKRPETASSIQEEPLNIDGGSLKRENSIGSPGPSIINDDDDDDEEEEEEEVPPILPGFVLTAGSRSSLMRYGKRKSQRESKRSGSGLGFVMGVMRD